MTSLLPEQGNSLFLSGLSSSSSLLFPVYLLRSSSLMIGFKDCALGERLDGRLNTSVKAACSLCSAPLQPWSFHGALSGSLTGLSESSSTFKPILRTMLCVKYLKYCSHIWVFLESTLKFSSRYLTWIMGCYLNCVGWLGEAGWGGSH